MPINLTPNTSTQNPMGGTTQVQPFSNQAANAVQGYNGAVGNSLQPLVQALMKQRLNNLLTGRLPGTTGQTTTPGGNTQMGASLANGTAASDFATGPQVPGLSLGQAPTAPMA